MTRGFSTAAKIAIARQLFRLVSGLRRVTGRRGHEVVCRRRGVRWSLDLREGVQLALYLGVYEPTTTRRLREIVRPGGVVVDVGANVGAHTLTLARSLGPAGRVVAVEPTDTVFARLQRNLRLNPELESRVVPVHAALGAEGGTAAPRYYSAWPLVPASSDRHPVHLGEPQAADRAGFFTLDALLDSLQLSSVSLIKIDVDGSELDVLQGARRVLQRDRPVLVLELCPYLLEERGQSAHDLVAFCDRYGYELFDERTLAPVGGDAARLVAGIPEGGGQNLIARAVRSPA